MRLLAIDGNSIFNRAFYGIKLLSTKDGRYTNAIYGFLNILIKLRELVSPDAIAVAFDVKEPTFRHKMYDGYKAARKGMPPELAQQLPVLKEILTLAGYAILEAPGWEADDILGTLANACREQGAACDIATGDRDSLQLVGGGVRVLLAATKMGRPETTVFDQEKIREVYGIAPAELIEMKALMGDSSDNIPGVAGVGEKTAGDLIARFHTVDNIYASLDTLDIKESVRNKLRAGKDMAYLSRDLGRIRTDAPIPLSLDAYLPAKPKAGELSRCLSNLEMFQMIERLGIEDSGPVAPEAARQEKIPVETAADLAGLYQKLHAAGKAWITVQSRGQEITGAVFGGRGTLIIAQGEGDGAFPHFLQQVLEDPAIEKYVHDSKPLHAWAIRHNTHMRNVGMDTLLAAYILNPSASGYPLERLAQEYNVPMLSGSDVPEGWEKEVQQAALLPPVAEKLEALIAGNRQEFLLHEIEIPLAEVLADMEVTGFAVDAGGIRTFGEIMERRIQEIETEIYTLAGYSFNLNSPKQLGEALFVKLGLPAGKKTKSGYSTNAEVLEGLAQEHPVVAKVLEYRQLAKLKSTYCDGLLKVIGGDGRIHSTLNQTETRTGRISSTEPNLQNIPVRQELGRELRKFFIAKEGCLLADADYSQIELRVLADIADDEVMIDAFNQGEDIHRITASQVFGLPPELVTSLLRSRAKAVNFGIVYGIGAFSLAKDIGVSRPEAARYIKDYLSHYAGVAHYMERMIALAKERGYCETLFGRRRYLPELTSSNANLRNFGERVARNMPIQGTAADIIKIAMIRVFRRLSKEGLKAKLILQVHDELIVEAPEAEADAAAAILQEEMEAACKMKVNLCADVHTARNWYDAKG